MSAVNTDTGNRADIGGYRLIDHMARRAVSSLSHVIGVKNVTRPFWNRWRASGIDDATLMNFLSRIDSIDQWPEAAMQLLAEEELALESVPVATHREERIELLRRLSYLAHMAQWGSLPMTDLKRTGYTKSRDYYIEAETLEWGERYKAVRVPFDGHEYAANLHLPEGPARDLPLIVILHGMDDTKEEHLATEGDLCRAGFAVLNIDGPGQGESLILENRTWPADFHMIVPAAIDAMVPHGIDPQRVGVIGISWGGLWALKAASADPRVAAVYDLGGPVDAGRWKKLPYFLKSKYGQVLGIDSADDLPDYQSIFSITDRDILNGITVPVRIVHGGKDPLVKVRDKEWLRDTLLELHPGQDVTLLTYPDGDHCCTGHGAQIRVDGAEFFRATLGPAAASGRPAEEAAEEPAGEPAEDIAEEAVSAS